MISHLLDEYLLLFIFGYLSIKDIYNFISLNKEMYKSNKIETTMKFLLDKEVKENLEENVNYKDIFKKDNYKEIYKMFKEIQDMQKLELLTKLKVVKIYNKKNLYLNGRLLSSKVQTIIATFKNLKHLDLSNNKLKEIPPIFSNLIQLEELRLEYNELTEFPKILSLVNLKLLYLHNNFITTIPDEIDNLSNLNELSLDFNPLILIPDKIKSLDKLKDLSVDGTMFKKNIDTIKFLYDKKVSIYIDDGWLIYWPFDLI